MNLKRFEQLTTIGTNVTIEYTNSQGGLSYSKGEVVRVNRSEIHPKGNAYYIKFNLGGVEETIIFGGFSFYEYSRENKFNIVSMEMENEFGETFSVPSERLLEFC